MLHDIVSCSLKEIKSFDLEGLGHHVLITLNNCITAFSVIKDVNSLRLSDAYLLQ